MSVCIKLDKITEDTKYMYVSLNWLKQHVDLPTDIDPKDLALRLTMATVEVEEIKKKAENLDGVVVGELLEIKRHPNADKLSIAKVDVGEDKPRQIIFGQMVDMSPGFKVPVALAPTILPGNKKIEKAKLRGEESEGMLCLDQELGLLKEGVSIHFFEKDVKNGTPIKKALGLDDVIIEIDNKSVTNRPDLWGHYGLAREVAAIYGLPLKEYAVNKLKSGKGVSLSVEVNDCEACPRYMAVAVKGIKVGQSPEWLRRRMEAIGQKSINNIVDVTNYLMFDLGQPLHAFSADKIADGKIIVRRAEASETLTTLDGVKRSLEPTDLVIADKDRAVALAGVMGSADSEIHDATETIIIESANFEPATIRLTANRLGLRSEAAMRFEKSLDPKMTEMALRRAVDLIVEMIPGAKVASAIIDVRNFKQFLGPIEISWDFINKRIGQPIDQEKIVGILSGLGFGVKKKKQGLSVRIPTWRATKDIGLPEDLIEEVARVYGYDNIVSTMPLAAMEYVEENKLRQLERQVKDLLAIGAHANEVYNSSFSDAAFLTRLGAPLNEIELENPWTQDSRFMRSSLVPNLLKNVSDNLRFYEALNIFEVGKVFVDDGSGEIARPGTDERLPSQDLHVTGVIVGVAGTDPFFAAKGTVQKMCSELGLNVDFVTAENKMIWCHPRQHLEVVFNKAVLGYVAAVHPAALQAAGIGKASGLFDLNLDKLVKHFPMIKKYTPLAKYPAVPLDLSIVVGEDTPWQAIKQLAEAVDSVLVQSVDLLDVFKNDKIESGKKSITLRATYRAIDRTLSLEEAMKLHEKLAGQLAKAYGAEVRR